MTDPRQEKATKDRQEAAEAVMEAYDELCKAAGLYEPREES